MQTLKAKVKSMSVSFQPDIFTRINSYCAERGCSRSWFINKAAEMFLAECLEDKADYETAVAAWAEYEKSGFKSSSADEVFKEAGL